jgi:dCMP deaminase
MAKQRPDWYRYALMLAKTAAMRSEDPYMKVGAVVVRKDNSVASIGYNGAPPGIKLDWQDREKRRKFVIHADTEGGFIAITHRPCSACLPVIAAHGILHVVYAEPIDPVTYEPGTLDEIAEKLGIQVRRIEGVSLC